MADNSMYNIKHQELNSNLSKLYSHFLYKALIVTIFVVVLPLFPSQAPEFINQTLNTRGWEFLHLLFVGIAVSYGLFSRRNQDSDKEQTSKFDNAQSYVSRFLQVSSVFDDDVDTTSGSNSSSSACVQAWNNQYLRNKPVVVVAKEQNPHVLDRQIGERPLFLPVRSLKSRVLDSDGHECSEKTSSSVYGSVSKSSSDLGSKGFSRSSMKKRQDLECKIEDNVVLRSPIPWRSRSARMETISPYSSIEESEFNRHFRSQLLRPPQPNSPKLSSPPSASFSAEAQSKSAEDSVRKKSFYSSPPPPPPPPQFFRRPRSSTSNNSFARSRKEKELEEQVTSRTRRTNNDRVRFMAEPTYLEFQAEEKEDQVENLGSESDEEAADESSSVSRSKNEEEESNSESLSDGGPDVDKKADEFIAKFREQIRLQRIESIKKSSGHINRKASK